MTLRVLIADDESPARAKVRRLLEGDPRFAVVGEARDGFEALAMLEATKPDLLFLDVQMPGLNGFEVLERAGAERRFAVVFSTAYDDYALEAFDVHAIDYLLKPYDRARFDASLEKALRQLSARERHLLVRTEVGVVAIEEASLLRLSVDGKHVVLSTSSGAIITRKSLNSIARGLDTARFVRVHRGEMVNVTKVTRYEPTAHGDGVLTLCDGSAVPLSRSFRAAFLESFGRRG